MSGEYVPDEPARNNMLGENTPDREDCQTCDGNMWLYVLRHSKCEWSPCPDCNPNGEEPTE